MLGRARSTLVLIVASCLLFQKVGAQSSASLASTGAPGDAEIAEIVVTAEKRSEKLLDVPISITVITPAVLNDTASKNLEELQGVIPGVTVPAATAYGGSSIVIRGTSGSGVFLEDDPVAVYVDGIYQPSNSRFGVADLTDVAGIEIVRGPQGTLQGRNATAGAILLRTADPSTVLDGYFSVSHATPTETRVSGAVSLPVSPTFGIRLSADYFDEAGWARNLYNGDHLGGEVARNGRAVMVWRPSDRFSARLSLNYQSLTNTQASQRWSTTNINPTGVAEMLGAPTPYVPLPLAQQNFYLNHKVVYNNEASINTQQSPSGALELHFDIGPVEAVSLTGGSHASNRGSADSGGLDAAGTNGVPLIDAVTGEERRAYNQGLITGSQFSEELRLQSTAVTPFKWLVGGYYSHNIDDFHFDIFDYNLASAPPGDGDVGFAAHQVDDSLAAFTDATYALTDKLSITGGLRYSHEEKHFNNAFSVTIPEIDLIVVGPLPYAPPRTTWDATSYRVNVAYKITDDTNIYISNSDGFKSGGFNAFGVGTTPSFKPEYLYSTEIGIKSYFLGRRGYVAASAYDNRYDNLQVTAGVVTGGVNIYNAAKASIKGFEVEGQIKATDQLSLTANASYTHARYTQFENGEGVDGTLVNATGNTLPNTPSWQYYAQGSYDIPLSAQWTTHAQLNYRWRGRVYFFATNEESNLSGAPDGELGARLAFEYSPQRFTLALYGRNLTDTRVVTGEQADFAYPVAFFNQPRVIGIQATKEF